MRILSLPLSALLVTLLSGSAFAAGQAAAPSGDGPQHPELSAIAKAVSPQSLHEIDAALVGFGTRSTLSDTRSDTRGIGAARRWVKSRFEAISKDCDGCLQVVTPSQVFTGKRTPPEGVEVMDVVAIQRGTSDPDRVIVITGHLDSRRTDVMDATGDAPGANDDASGVSALIEAARVLSKYRFPATLVFSADSGEEQGLYGGKVIAQYAVNHGWKVEANLNNDIVGSPNGGDGQSDPHTVRVFSEGTKSNETLEQAQYRRYHGGEIDSPSRNLARYMQGVADRYLEDFRVRVVYRTDRYGRGGDQVEFLARGFPAVRVTESHEDYTHQHQDIRTVDGVHYGDTIEHVDFDYLANVTRLDAITMASLAMAPAPPSGVAIQGEVAYDTTVSWKPVPGAKRYRVWWRETTAPRWEHARDAGDATSLKLPGINIDDYYFGVSSVSADGWESPVVFPGFAGSFERSPAAPETD
ncbi:M28 family metallopeptidase [Cognatiluteimonas telluris]|uniref:M28 family metallopeptidase n=1 Tax=Cognatiluteimonas telluris TaxID=1104775 RepID=UPI00311AA608